MNDYRIIEAPTSLAVETEVRKLITAGWEPLGSLAVVTRSDFQPERQVIYVQAMILDRQIFDETISSTSRNDDRRPTLVRRVQSKVGDLR